MDAENQILPIAFGVSKNESIESWTWFFQKLHECIGDMQDLAIVSDRAACIQTSMRNVFPQAFHGVCGYHLYANVASRFGKKNEKLRDMFWRACKAYTVGEHEDAMRALHGKYDKAWLFLKGIEPEKWTRAHFPANRYSIMTSNSVESLNALSKDARKMPVLMLVEFFRETMQKWSYNHRNSAAEMTTTLTRWADKKVGKKKKRIKNWNVHPIDNLRFEVKDFDRNGVVNFADRTCDCRVWQVLGLPCAHVMTVLVSKGYSDCAQYAKFFYLTDTLRSTYAEVDNPLPAPGDWEIPEDLMTVKAPVMARRQPGRPKNTDRIPSQGESPIKKECTTCGAKGHTKINCTSLRFKGGSAGSSRSGKQAGRGRSGNNGGSVIGSQSEFVYPTADLNTDHM